MTKNQIVEQIISLGYTDLAKSTLMRKSVAALEGLLIAVQTSANDGKEGDLANSATDCGGCENGDCDNCGYYECCAETDDFDAIHETDEDLVPDYNATGDLVSWMLNLAEMGYAPTKVGQELAGQAQSDGQAKIMKDREALAPALDLVRETMKVVTAAGYQKDPENMKAALTALAQIASKAADQI